MTKSTGSGAGSTGPVEIMSDNPAAFPCTGEGFGSELYTQKGMTLRDWFAGQALPLCWELNSEIMRISPDNRLSFTDETASDAYAFADAMLAARKQEQSA